MSVRYGIFDRAWKQTSEMPGPLPIVQARHRPVHEDNWKIAACPVNGPMLSARGRDVVLAWFTVQDDVGHAYAAFSVDAGRTFGAPIRLNAVSALGRVDVALLPDGSAVATWIEFAEQKSSFSMRRVEPSGGTSPMTAVTAISGARASGYPRIAFHRDEVVFAWTETDGGQPILKTAVAKVALTNTSLRWACHPSCRHGLARSGPPPALCQDHTCAIDDSPDATRCVTLGL